MPLFQSYIPGLLLTSSAQAEKKLACERAPLRHTAASNLTHSAIADQDSSLLRTCTASMRVADSTAVHCCVVMRGCVGLHCACSTLRVARTCARLRYSDSVHGSLYMSCGVVCSVCCRAPLECAVSAHVQLSCT